MMSLTTAHWYDLEVGVGVGVGVGGRGRGRGRGRGKGRGRVWVRVRVGVRIRRRPSVAYPPASSTLTTRSAESEMWLGRCGARVAKTPCFFLGPRGGVISGRHPVFRCM